MTRWTVLVASRILVLLRAGTHFMSPTSLLIGVGAFTQPGLCLLRATRLGTSKWRWMPLRSSLQNLMVLLILTRGCMRRAMWQHRLWHIGH